MLKRLFLSVIFFKSALIISQIPVWHWAKDANSSSPETLWDVSTDPTSTNVYVGGTFKGNLSAKYGSAFTTSSGNYDAFLAKYDASGNVIWAFKIAGSGGDEEVRGVAVDPSGDVYVTGNFNNTVDFDPSLSSFNLTTAGGTDGFLAKYSSTGNFLWAVKFGGSSNENSYKMAADANGIYITGSYESIPTTFYSYSSPVTKTTFFTDSQMNMFGAKYNSNGIVQWVISGGSNLDDYGIKVIADAASVYFFGIYYHDMSFKNATGVSGAVLPDEQHNKANTFILQVTQAGNLGWQTNITSSQGGKDVNGWSIAQDAGNLYVTGQSDGNINFKYPTPTLTQVVSNNNDLFLAKLSKASGTFLWNTSATGNGSGDQVGRTLEVNSLGNIILGGSFNTSLNYSVVGGPNFTASGQDIFVTGYTNAGAFLWSYKAGGSGNENANGLSTDNYGNIYLAGDHGGAATFGTVTLGSGGNTDIYLAKLGCPVVTNNTISVNQTICSGNTPSALAGSIPTNGNLYTWEMSINSTTWTSAAGTYTNQNYAPSPLTATTYYRRTASDAGCLGSPSNTLQINVVQPPSISNAGITQTLCTSSATLNATPATSGSGVWSVITGTGNVTSINNPLSQVTGLSYGSNSFAWTVSNSPCASSTSTVTIIRDIPPSSSAGNQQTVCSATATLAAVNPAVGTGIWSVGSGTSNVVNVGNPSSQVAGLSIGSNSFLWSVTNGVCPTATSAVIIMRDDMPTVSNAGNNQTVCSTTYTLNGNVPIVGTAAWSVITGNSTINAITNPVSQINNLSVGQNKFVWTISNGVCPSSTSTLTLNRDDFPTTAFAGNSQSVCSASCTLSANLPVIGVGQWSLISGTSIISDIDNFSTLVSDLSVGQNKFAWTITNGVCVPSSSTVIITRDQEPSLANAGQDKTICGSTATLDANVPAVGLGNWNFISGGGTANDPSDPNSVVVNLNSGSNTIVWTVSNGVCISNSDTVIIQSDAMPSIANAGNDQTVCSDNLNFSANIPSVGIGSWSIISGSANISTLTQNNSFVGNLAVGQTIFKWTIANGICPVSTDDIIITRDLPPDNAVAGPDLKIDSPVADLSAFTPSVGVGQWSVVSGDAQISDPNNSNTTVRNLSFGENVIRWTTRNGVCSESSDDIVIYVNPLRIPNGFSPNNDGFNDAYVIPSLEFYPNVKFTVFNRWGGLVYENNSYQNNWFGTNTAGEKLSDDTYYYVLEINEKTNYTGFIILKQNK